MQEQGRRAEEDNAVLVGTAPTARGRKQKQPAARASTSRPTKKPTTPRTRPDRRSGTSTQSRTPQSGRSVGQRSNINSTPRGTRQNAVLVGHPNREGDTEISSSEADESYSSDSSYTPESDLDELEASSDREEDTRAQQRGLRLPGAMPLVPRTDHVDSTIRRKIRKGEYVNLRHLVGIKKKSITRNSLTGPH